MVLVYWEALTLQGTYWEALILAFLSPKAQATTSNTLFLVQILQCVLKQWIHDVTDNADKLQKAFSIAQQEEQ